MYTHKVDDESQYTLLFPLTKVLFPLIKRNEN